MSSSVRVLQLPWSLLVSIILEITIVASTERTQSRIDCTKIDSTWRLVYSTGDLIGNIPSDGAPKTETKRNLSSPITPSYSGVTYDVNNNIAYSINGAKVSKTKFGNGRLTTQVILDSGFSHLGGIAFDWITGNLYLLDSGLAQIFICNNFCSVVLNGKKYGTMKFLVLDANNGVMFWTQVGVNGSRIMKSEMDGRGVTSIVSVGIVSPTGLAMDQCGDRIYWADLGNIWSSTLNGTDVQRLNMNENARPLLVDVLGNRVFWSDVNEIGIKSADKLTGQNVKMHPVPPGHDKIGGFSVEHPVNQQILRENPCAHSNCSHICTQTAFPSEKAFRCLCPPGTEFKGENETSCNEARMGRKLAVVVHNTISMMSLDSVGQSVFDQGHDFNNDSNIFIQAVTYNPLSHTFIFADHESKQIFEYRLNSKEPTVLVKETHTVKSLTFDPVARNIYWIDGASIQVFSLKTGRQATFFHEAYSEIAFLPREQALLVAKKTKGGLTLFRLGSNEELEHVQTDGDVTGLAVDADMGSVKWVKEGTTQIRCMTKVGNEIFWMDDKSPNAIHSMKLGMGEGKTRRVYEIGQHIGKSGQNNDDFVKLIVTGVDPVPAEFKYLRRFHNCSEVSPNYKRCSHVCVSGKTEFSGKCLCPPGHHLKGDGLTCTDDSKGEPIILTYVTTISVATLFAIFCYINFRESSLKEIH